MNQQQLLQQARKLQEQLARIQEELGNERVTGTAGGGAVEATFDGHGNVVGIKIDPQAVDAEDVESLEDLLLAAVKDAQAKVAELSKSRLGPLTGLLGAQGLGIPGL
jgi:nucleoid-associated protein EbfC